MKTRFLQLTTSIIMFVFATPVLSQTTGPNTPGNSYNQPYADCPSCPGAIWTSTANVSAADNQYSEVQLQNFLNCYQSSCFRSRYLVCSDFGFSIPADALITGIKVQVNGFCDTELSVFDSTVILMKSNSPCGGNMASPSPWPTMITSFIYGGLTELWGLSWTPQEINSPGFGAFIKVYNSSSQAPKVYVDEVSITVSYSLATSVFSQTSSPRFTPLVFDHVNKDLLVISDTDGRREFSLEIYDLKGLSRLSMGIGEIASGVSVTRVSLNGLNHGLYLVRLVLDGKIYTTRILI